MIPGFCAKSTICIESYCMINFVDDIKISIPENSVSRDSTSRKFDPSKITYCKAYSLRCVSNVLKVTGLVLIPRKNVWPLAWQTIEAPIGMT